ncbi:hypothetical protein [Pseudoalteromonas rubra]|uniref:hypothetical protein n=1 Tax=Pseudoalteromonas rubra TaxID=43658 RepID=UPI0012F78502|nr:hypothetical protein [Pseudoalteromonas rubra]
MAGVLWIARHLHVQFVGFLIFEPHIGMDVIDSTFLLIRDFQMPTSRAKALELGGITDFSEDIV